MLPLPASPAGIISTGKSLGHGEAVQTLGPLRCQDSAAAVATAAAFRQPRYDAVEDVGSYNWNDLAHIQLP
jgi:hypothetical protein